MGQAGRERYIDVGESRVEEAGRIEVEQFRQVPPEDFTSPDLVVITTAGSKRRTSFTSAALVENGPDWTDGSRTAWFVTLDANGDTQLVSVENATELANLPSDAISAQEYANQIAVESPSLAAEFFGFLTEDASPHTAHHTTGADVGPRVRTIFQRDQLGSLVYQDSLIGQGISIPDIVRRPRDPATLVGDDQVEW